MGKAAAITIVAAGALFAAICLLLRQVFLRLSGWSRLRRRYAAQPPERGWAIRGESVTVGPVRFRRILRATDSPEGIHLAVGGLAPLPAIFIPWREFAGVRRARFYSTEVMELALPGDAPRLQISMTLYERIHRRLEAASHLS